MKEKIELMTIILVTQRYKYSNMPTTSTLSTYSFWNKSTKLCFESKKLYLGLMSKRIIPAEHAFWTTSKSA